MNIRHCALAITLAACLPTTNADVGSALTDYFNSMQANTKIERPSLTTNGVTAGGYYQRGANVDLTLGYITPPSLKGSCGNIDFNMGAFSFISGDEIVAALQAIGQNAKGMLFTEAIELVSAGLAGNIKAWIDQANKWMGILKNSCQAASMLVGGVNNAMGMCQNASRYNGSLSDENTIQKNCQTFDNGMRDFKKLFGADSSLSQDEKGAKSALIDQISMEGGILQNLLAEYFASSGRINVMQRDLGNIVLSVVGDVYVPSIETNNDDSSGFAKSVTVGNVLSISDLLSYSVESASKSIANNKPMYDCDFAYDADNLRAKNICFIASNKTYKTGTSAEAATIHTTVSNQLKTIHDSLLKGTPITSSQLTVIGLAEAPVFQLMQAGIDVGLDQETMVIVNKYMDYVIHKLYFNLFANINTGVQMIIASKKGNEDQKFILTEIQKSLDKTQKTISDQITKDVKDKNLDIVEVTNRLKEIRRQIMLNVSPNMQQQLAATANIQN